MSVRAYTLSAISVTASAIAGLWLGAIIVSSSPEATETVRSRSSQHTETTGVIPATPVQYP